MANGSWNNKATFRRKSEMVSSQSVSISRPLISVSFNVLILPALKSSLLFIIYFSKFNITRNMKLKTFYHRSGVFERIL